MEFMALEDSSLAGEDLLLTEVKQEIEDIEDEVCSWWNVICYDSVIVCGTVALSVGHCRD